MRPEIERARELRRNMREPEVMLWSRLRRLRERGFALRRQFPFRGYFLDFACLSYRFVVEVDGAQRNDELQAEHDAVRDRILQRQGFQVLRTSAGEVRRNLSGVVDHIVLTLEKLPRVRAAGPSAALAARSSPPHPGRCAACPSPSRERI
jgi:very-short-patch-repair endonuclease